MSVNVCARACLCVSASVRGCVSLRACLGVCLHARESPSRTVQTTQVEKAAGLLPLAHARTSCREVVHFVLTLLVLSISSIK